MTNVIPRHQSLLTGTIAGTLLIMLRNLLLLTILGACVAPPRYEAARFDGFREELLQIAERYRIEMAIPGIWIALLEVDPTTGIEHLWADVLSDGDHGKATATHRVASISKLFTNTAAMVLMERGQIDLDVPIQTYLPELEPENRYDAAITLRLLMGHRSGIVREPPIGNYFDQSEPTLRATVASLNQTKLVHAPSTTFKYSNAGIGIVGEVIARVTGMPFEAAVRDLVLAPMKLHDSDFAPRSDLIKRQAAGSMWTYDGRKIPTPEWRLGYVPAAELRSTTVDLVKFARSWFPVAPTRVIRKATQESMWVPADNNTACGLGFFVSKLDGHLRVAHAGVVAGFASTLAALPDQGLAVAVICTKDFVTSVSDAIADQALQAALANRRGESIKLPRWPQPLGVKQSRELAGTWRVGDNWVRIYERDGDLYYDPNIGVRTRMRLAADGSLIADDPLGVGPTRRLTILPNGNLKGPNLEYTRDESAPEAAPPELLEFLGEYGSEHNSLIVYEDGGRLAVLIEWFRRDLPDFEEKDRYSFPPGTYHDDELQFRRNHEGKVHAVLLSGARLERRPAPSTDSFQKESDQSTSALVAVARKSSPPLSLTIGKLAHDLISPLSIAGGAGMQFDSRHEMTNQLFGAKLSDQSSMHLQRPAAEALVRVHQALAKHDVGIQMFEGYQPWWITKVIWDAAPQHLKRFVSDPNYGSQHNRGCAVSLTLYNRKTRKPINMPSGYGELSERAYADYPGGTSRQRFFRELLRGAMESEGFHASQHAWWQFVHKDWREYPVSNEPPASQK